MYKSKFRNHWTVIEYPSKILIVSVISSPITIINHMVFSYMAILLDRIYEEQRNLLGVFACFINKAKSTLFKTNWASSNKFRGFVKFSISQAKMFGQAKWQRLSKWTTQTNHFHSSGRSAKRTRAKRPPLPSKRSPAPIHIPFHHRTSHDDDDASTLVMKMTMMTGHLQTDPLTADSSIVLWNVFPGEPISLRSPHICSHYTEYLVI